MSLVKSLQEQILRKMVLIPAAGVCLAYVLFKRDFAKIHLDISFLNFPVFIGEMLLFFCVLCLAVYWFKHPPIWGRLHLAVGIYLVFVMIKTVQGYVTWGPLAFRHAALFYYPFFFMIGYVFFSREFFTKRMILGAFGVIILVFLVGCYDRYWTLTLALLAGVLILSVHDRRTAYIMTFVLLAAIPYIFLFKTARMMFVANMASLGLLLVAFMLFTRFRKGLKIIVATFLIFLIAAGFYRFFILGESGRVFAPLHEIILKFNEMDREVQEKKTSYRMEHRQVGLYHPKTQSRSYYYRKQQDGVAVLPESSMPTTVGAVSVHHGEGQIDVRNEATAVTSVAVNPMSAPLLIDPVKEGQDKIVVINLEGFEKRLVKKKTEEKPVILKEAPTEWVSMNNIIFRLFIWRDMIEDWGQTKPFWGVDLGRPFRSPSLEVLRWAEEEWSRDGWIEPHNSYLNICYRAGMAGVLFVISIIAALVYFIYHAFKRRSWKQVLLAAIFLNWLVAANFLLILELPYTAIPFWMLAGMAFAYVYRHHSQGSLYEIKR